MLLEGSATIFITVRHINSVPHPACEDASGGLITSVALLEDLKAMTVTGETRDAVDRVQAVSDLVSERDRAIAESKGRTNIRVRALTQLATTASDGLLVAGPTAYDLACSASGLWTIPMPTEDSRQLLNISLLAFDKDDTSGGVYQIVKGAEHGMLFATTALPGSSYSQVSFER